MRYVNRAMIEDVGEAALGEAEHSGDWDTFAIVAAALTTLVTTEEGMLPAREDLTDLDVDSPELSAVDVVRMAADFHYGELYDGT